MTSDSTPQKRILLIDDDVMLLEFLADLLEAVGCVVVKAENGRAGLAACRRSLPNLAITDIAMPEMDGVTFIRHAKAEFSSLPVVAMSGGLIDSDTNLERAAAAGAVATLQKPFSVDEFLSIVDLSLTKAGASSGGHSHYCASGANKAR